MRSGVRFVYRVSLVIVYPQMMGLSGRVHQTTNGLDLTQFAKVSIHIYDLYNTKIFSFSLHIILFCPFRIISLFPFDFVSDTSHLFNLSFFI